MQELIAQLSKIDQRNAHVALIHAGNGNYRVLDSMVRSANRRSLPIMLAIRELV